MPDSPPSRRFRFGIFEADTATGELRRKGMRVRLHAQPFQVLILLLNRPGEMLSREQISRELWPEGTFVDYEHGVNSAVNRLREALGDRAANPRFIETLARRGYRFVAPVEELTNAVTQPPADAATPANLQSGSLGVLDRLLAAPHDLPKTSPSVVQTLFVLLQAMYLGFYVGALANLPEINQLLSDVPFPALVFATVVVSAAVLIPVRIFLATAVLFHAPAFPNRYRKLWPFLFPFDLLWSLAPFLLLHHMSFGLALACVPPLIYSPLAQRALVTMGAGAER